MMAVPFLFTHKFMQFQYIPHLFLNNGTNSFSIPTQLNSPRITILFVINFIQHVRGVYEEQSLEFLAKEH